MTSIFVRATFAAALLLSPIAALAHETQQFRINDTVYVFTVGSLNEPVIVDDKTGIDLRVAILPPGATKPEDQQPVEGLETTLTVEIAAEGDKKELDLSTQYGKPGSYKATFFPTVQTEYSYRFFGTLKDHPIDLLFTCNSSGHEMHGTDDTSEVAAGQGVTRILKRGAFGCPQAKEAFGFPESAPTLRELHDATSNGLIAILLSSAALVIAIAAWIRTGRSM